jgi:hypothetical protein
MYAILLRPELSGILILGIIYKRTAIMAFVLRERAYRIVQRAGERDFQRNRYKGCINIRICILGIDWKAFSFYNHQSFPFISLHELS